MTMTVQITCDGCGDSAEASTQYDAGANEIDSQLEIGWAHSASADYCPACAPDHDED